jgi:AraC-like DNA-binding protein
VDAGLGDRDSVQGAVELSVSAAVESVSSVFAGAGLERCDPGVSGELGVGVEAFDRAELAKQFGGAQRAATGQGQQRLCALLGSSLQFAVEFENAPREAAAAGRAAPGRGVRLHRSPLPRADLTPRRLAAVNLSSGHLTTIVRRKTGRPVQEWIKERRMAQARRLLVETDLTIDQLARQVGYADSVYFVRTFRRVHGTTPSLAADRTRVARGRTHVGVETAP